MNDEKNKPEGNIPLTGKERGPQGIDKAPGEEVSKEQTHFTQDAQKGKKVDADPEQESDKPVNQP
jgi:hypothetical protein